MELEGNLIKMQTELVSEVKYTLKLGDDEILMNDLLNKEIKISYQNQINCISCGKKTKTSFAQGFCYKCFQSDPMASPCVLRPELCEAHIGKSRDMEWSKKYCLTDHYVYLALSSAVKVGVTRHTQIPTRWIDQGASSAIIIAKTPNRYFAGRIEVELKNIFTDKTNWQKMLKNTILSGVNLENEKQNAWEYVDDELKEYFTDDDTITEIKYPVVKYPEKVKSINFDKIETITGVLKGIKGQYLIFDDNSVLNIRKHGGYLTQIQF